MNNALNRRHEITKKRMEYRLDALHSFLPAFFAITENSVSVSELSEMLTQTNTKQTLNKHQVSALLS